MSIFRLNQEFGMFSESSLLPWQGFITSVIRNVVFSIECFFIASIDFSWSMRTGLRESTAIFVRLFRRLWTNIWTVAIRSVVLHGFGVQSVARKDSSCSPAKSGDFAHPVMQRELRSGASGCGSHLCWLCLTARSSSPSPGCCGYSSNTTENFSLAFASAASRLF